MDKNGISPIIAFVLVISLVVSLGAFVSIWYKNASTKQIESALEQLENTAECANVKFEVSFDYETCTITLFNSGEEIINNMVVSYSFADGTKQSETEELDIAENARKSIEQVPNFQKVVFTPILVREGTQITCTDEREFSLQNPFQCCYSDEDCPGELNLCQNNACTLVECMDDGHCGLFEICTDNTCGYIPCQNNPDCTYPQMPICDKDKKICIGCTKNAECTDPLYPICLDFNCVGCIVDGGCIFPATCQDNVCVEPECLTNNDCSIWQSCKNQICDYCSNDADCDLYDDEQCSSNDVCLVNCNSCDDPDNCGICEDNERCVSDAGAQADLCMRRNGAVCEDDGQCESNMCISGTCAECKDNSQCLDPLLPLCSLNTNQCVQCIGKADCSKETPACDPNTNTCVECTVDAECPKEYPLCAADNTCVACIVNKDCPKGTYCFHGSCTGLK